MTLLQMPEDMAMAAVDAAAATGQPIAFYCYSPHPMFKLHVIVHLTEPKHDPAASPGGPGQCASGSGLVLRAWRKH